MIKLPIIARIRASPNFRQTVLRYDPAGRAGPAPNARRSRCSARPSAQRNGLMLVMNCSIISMRTNSSSPMSSMV